MSLKDTRFTRDEGTLKERFLQFPWEMLIFVAVVIELTYILQRWRIRIGFVLINHLN